MNEEPGTDRGATAAAGSASERIRRAWEERSLYDLRWLVAVRWIAVIAMLAVILVADRVLAAVPWPAYLYAAVFVLAVANLVFHLDLRRFSRLTSEALHRRALLQACVDIVVLVTSVHCAGGVENPFIFFLVFHITVFSVLFSQLESLALAVTAWGLVVVFLISERVGITPFDHAHLEGVVPPTLHTSPWYVIGFLAALALTLIFTALLVGRICRHFHREKREAEETCEVLRRHEEELERTTDEVRKLLGQVEADGDFSVRYQNPNVVACWEIRKCEEVECPAYGSSNLRCWNVAARHCAVRTGLTPGELHCPRCTVYRTARPDRLTEIGESFNSVMDLLQVHALRSEALRGQALEQEKMAAIGRMAAGVAHEVGNPLASISALVQLLKRRAEDGKLKGGLDEVLSHVERISETVQQLCTFARPAQAAVEPVNIAELAGEALRLLSYDRRLKEITVKNELESALPPIEAAGKELTEVFVNLILNAVDAMAEGGTLTLSAGRRGALVYVEVCDTGVGMTPDTVKRIFEPFYTTKPAGKGTGLGLSVSYATVQRYGGTITVKSVEKEGSVFTVSFPLLVRGKNAVEI